MFHRGCLPIFEDSYILILTDGGVEGGIERERYYFTKFGILIYRGRKSDFKAKTVNILNALNQRTLKNK